MFTRIILSVIAVFVSSLTVLAQDTGESRTLYVGPVRVDCEGVGPQQCLLVKEDPQADYELFYDHIEGFEFEPGYTYELRVTVTEVANPPADASSMQWSLDEVVSQNRALQGNLWELTAYTGADGNSVNVLPDSQVTVLFEFDQLGGSAGCNTYGGGFMLTEMNLEIGELVSTQMACTPDELMPQETAYLNALSMAVSYQINDDQLDLLNADGDVILSYAVIEPVALTGTTWVMTDYNNGQGGLVSALAEPPVTALFDGVGQVGGSGGCNGYGGSYEASDGMMTIGEIVSTLMACAEQGVTKQEQAYFAALENVAAYTISANTLELTDGEGNVMVRYEARANELTGVTWQWQSANYASGDSMSVPQPERYTLTFNADGSVGVRADCNTGSATYERNGDQITIIMGPLTRAMCPPESLSMPFIEHLGAVSTLELSNGNLLLSPGTGGETLVFTPLDTM